jgi:hypothetical protein
MCSQHIGAATRKSTHRDTDPFYVENLTTWEEKPWAKATRIFFHYNQMRIHHFFSLESTRGSKTSRYKQILDAATRFGAQELQIEAISQNIVEQQLEGD